MSGPLQKETLLLKMSREALTQRWIERQGETWPTHLKARECETPLDLWELVAWWLDRVPDERKDSWFQEGRAALARLYELAASDTDHA